MPNETLDAAFASLFVAGDQDDVAVVIDAVMRAMAATDADHAHDLFAANPQHAEVKSDLESSLTGALTRTGKAHTGAGWMLGRGGPG